MNIIDRNTIGYQAADFESAVARWLESIFTGFSIRDPVDPSKILPVKVFLSDIPERDAKERNTAAPYLVAQFLKEKIIERGTLFKGRIIICTYGADRRTTRRDNEILGDHVMNGLRSRFLQVLAPFSIYLKDEYPIVFDVYDQIPVPNYCFGSITFYATSNGVTNDMMETLSKLLAGG